MWDTLLQHHRAPRKIPLLDQQRLVAEAIVVHRQYDNHDQEEMRGMLVERDLALDTGDRTIKKITKKCERLGAQKVKLEDRLVKTEEAFDHLQEEINYRPGKRNMSKLGGYNLAWRRNTPGTNTSAASAIAMGAGAAVHGSFHDHHIVTKCEYRAAACVDFRNEQFQSLVATNTAPTEGHTRSIVVHQYVGDATHSEAIDKSKMHLATLCTMQCAVHVILAVMAAMGQGPMTLDTCSTGVIRKKATCDMQVVNTGTGEELYRIIQRQVQSTGAATWEDACANSVTNTNCITTWVMGLDNGADNVGATRRIKERLKDSRLVMMWVVWCLFHQYHLVVKDILQTLDTWEFAEDLGFTPLPSPYYTCVSMICNVWRSCGIHRRLRNLAAHKYSDSVCEECFGKLPGRPIKGRWGCIDNIEVIIQSAMLYLSPLFTLIFPDKKEAKPKGPGHDADADFAEKQRQSRKNAKGALSNKAFAILLVVSIAVKRPMLEFLLWGQKQVRKQNDAIRVCRETETVYLGPTFLSNTVVWKAPEIYSKLWSLVDVEAFLNHGPWCPAMNLAEDRQKPAVIALILSVLLRSITNWHMRFTLPNTKFPRLFLHIVESYPHIPDDRRKDIARLLLDTSDANLDRAEDDFATKMKQLYKTEFEHMAATGECNATLFMHLLLVRAQLTGESQSIEGRNSVLQRMAKAAPNMSHALANTRIKLKMEEDPLTPSECARDDKAAVARLKTDSHQLRLVSCLDNLHLVPLENNTILPDPSEVQKLAYSYALGVYNVAVPGASHVWVFEAKAFIISWTYKRIVFVIVGTITGNTFSIDGGVEPLMMQDFLKECDVCKRGAR